MQEDEEEALNSDSWQVHLGVTPSGLRQQFSVVSRSTENKGRERPHYHRTEVICGLSSIPCVGCTMNPNYKLYALFVKQVYPFISTHERNDTLQAKHVSTNGQSIHRRC